MHRPLKMPPASGTNALLWRLMVCIRFIRRYALASFLVRTIYRAVIWMLSPAVMFACFEPVFSFLGKRRSNQVLCRSQIKSILVVRFEGVGDMVLTSAFLRELRRLFPKARITLFVAKEVVNLVERCPYVDEILQLEKTAYLRWHFWLKYLPYAATRLWSRSIDLAIRVAWDLDGNYAGAITYLSGAHRRLGYSRRMHNRGAAKENPDVLYTDLVCEPYTKHEVEHSLHLVRALGGTPLSSDLEVWIDEDDDLYARRLLSLHEGGRQGPLVALCPGASHRYKEWPESRYSALARSIIDQFDARILIIGGRQDKLKAERIVSCIEAAPGVREARPYGPILNCAGNTTLRQCAALLTHCTLYVGNDTGPMHIAAALGVPIVAVSAHAADGADFKQLSPLRFGPWKTKSRVLQPAFFEGPCGSAYHKNCRAADHDCIHQVSLEEVMDAVINMLKQVELAAGEIHPHLPQHSSRAGYEARGNSGE